jgi:molybdopterin molybdotransferase
MIEFEEALSMILKNTGILPAEEVPLDGSMGRVLKEDAYSGIEMPPFDKSAVDGYAVKSSDVKKIPARLRCLGLIQAGEAFGRRLARGECVKIMTGAPMPKGADSVVMVEDSRQQGKYVELSRSAEKGENVCFKGEDLKKRQKVLQKGIRISPSHVAVLATIGIPSVKASGRPRVAILNTGGEIVPLGKKLGRNKIYNSNGPMLSALLKADGIEPRFLGIAKDNVRDLKKEIRRGLDTDILLISGGVSMGDYDLIPSVLEGMGIKKIFHKVNIKPGKPLFFARRKNTIIFGIPGNPVSNFLAYLIFVRPALNKMRGCQCGKPGFKEGVIETGFHSKLGRKHFVLVEVLKRENRYYLTPVTSHGSADVLALSKADGFMAIGPHTGVIKKGSKVGFITWKKI